MIALSTTVVKKILTEYEALFALDQSKHYVYNDQLSILDFILGQQLIATNFVSYDYSPEKFLRKSFFFEDDFSAQGS